MASGHVNRTQRPNTWLHRPSLRREDSPCQLGAVHTWPIASYGPRPTYKQHQSMAAFGGISGHPIREASFPLVTFSDMRGPISLRCTARNSDTMSY